jgi:hypothetical protein
MRFLIVFLLAIGLVFIAAKPGAWEQHNYISYQQTPVEQQTPRGAAQPDASLWVINPTDCYWDVDDTLIISYRGSLEPGGRFVKEDVCLIADWGVHLAGVKALTSGRHDDIRVGAFIGDYAVTSAAPTLISAKGDRWRRMVRACITSPDYDHSSPKLEPILNSNGGKGVIYPVSFWVENVGRNRIRDVRFYLTLTLNYNNAGNNYCPHGWNGGICEGRDPRVCIDGNS